MTTTPDGPVLVVNGGSGSVAVDLVDASDHEHPVVLVDRPLTAPGVADEVADALAGVGDDLVAVAHRLVHGGERTDPVLLDDAELARLDSIAHLAPLHVPPAVEAARRLRRRFPDIPAVACFDTEAHRDLDPAARTLPVPARWRRDHGVRRYGFHGPGHTWAAARTAELLGAAPADLELVTAHLGGGSSAAAVRGGRSVDTTMGFTPLGGMPMTTRTGSLDPGILLDLLAGGEDPDELAREVNHDSGLLGVSGTAADLRDLYPAADGGDEAARLAVDVHVRGVAQGIAAMATALDRLDAVAFTGGAGSGSARLRGDVCRRLGALGVVVDEAANAAADDGDGLVHDARSPVAVATVVAREATVIARSARRALAGR